MSLAVARDQFGIVEVVAGKHHARLPAGGRAARSPLPASSSEILMPSTLPAWRSMMVEHGVQRRSRNRRCPNSLQAPGRTCRPASAGSTLSGGLAEDAVVDAGHSRRATFGDCRQRAAGHHDRPAALRLDEAELLLIGGDHVVERSWRRRRRDGRCRRREARSAPCDGAAPRRSSGGSVPCAFAQSKPMPRCEVSIASAMLEAERPQMMPERQRRVPVDDRRRPGIGHRERIGDDMGRGIGDARESRRRSPAATGVAGQSCSVAIGRRAAGKTMSIGMPPSMAIASYKWNVPINQEPLTIR